MWSSVNKREVYFAEISRCKCWINAEIKYRVKSTAHGYMEMQAYYKAFSNGDSFKNPLQSDWILADKWAKDQLRLINEYGTDNVEFEIRYK